MNEEQDTKKIWTDSYKTKEILWESYEGYREHYSTYIMLKNLKKKDMFNEAGLLRYAKDFYEEIYYFFDDFKEKLGEEDIEKIKKIFKQEEFKEQDYHFMRRFFNKFMMKTGIKDVSIKIDDPNKAIEKNR